MCSFLVREGVLFAQQIDVNALTATEERLHCQRHDRQSAVVAELPRRGLASFCIAPVRPAGFPREFAWFDRSGKELSKWATG